MFKTLAKFWLLKPRRTAPHWHEAAHCNDNTPARRHPAGLRRSPRSVLACHWVFIDESRLECRWRVESFDETSVEQPDGHRITAKISGLPPGRVISLNPERSQIGCVARTSLDDAIQQHCPYSFLPIANDLQ